MNNRGAVLILLGIMVPAISFLFMKNYAPQLGVLWNVMNNDVQYFDKCLDARQSTYCKRRIKIDVPFKIVGSIGILLIGAGVYIQLTKPSKS